MIPVTGFAGQKVAVFGLGGSGLVSASALLAAGADVVGWDDDAKTVANAASAGIPIADLRHADWTKIAALVLAPGVPLTHPAPHWVVGLARAAAVEVIGDIELFCRERRRHAPNAPFVAITGTNGKSTTTALTAHLLASAGYDSQVGGNIGTAVLSLQPPGHGRVHVVEVSSYQIDLAPSLDPSVGILINVSEDHLDRHGTLAHYAAVKERLVAGVQDDGSAIVGVDDNWCQAAADRIEHAGKRVVRVSVRRPLADGIYVEAGRIVQAAGGSGTEIARLGGIGSLRGAHNAQNAACAAGAALALGLSVEQIQKGLRSFPGLAHRMEEVGRVGRVLFVNDSKATNADSSAQALACFSDIYWIAGGKPKTGGLSTLTGFFPRIRKAYLIGEAAAGFAAELEGKVPHVVAGTLDRAVELAARDAEVAGATEPVVLLSPACASFDQYRNFEVRGDAFRESVLALPGLVRTHQH
jgi:UDP-N-acetylmuramoylalanine--D-glutamate ligase